MLHAGDPNRTEPALAVRVAAKAHFSAAGTRLDVLRDLAFTLNKGETGALIGPSGCGKTSLMRLIAGIDRKFDGEIRLPAGARLGMVFQEPRLLPWRSVEDNVRLAAPAATDGALDSLFGALGLAAHRALFPGELSLGLARRVAIARAFAVEPDLLLLDEPFVSLDEALANKLRDELASLVAARHVTTLLVTHDIEEALRLANRIFLLSARPAHIVQEIVVNASTDAAGLRRQIAQNLAAVS